MFFFFQIKRDRLNTNKRTIRKEKIDKRHKNKHINRQTIHQKHKNKNEDSMLYNIIIITSHRLVSSACNKNKHTYKRKKDFGHN